MYNLKVYTSNIYVANYRDTVVNHGSVFSRNNLHFRSCIFTNCMFLIARHYHWRKAVSNKREIALLKKIQLVSKRRDNFKCWVLLLLFSLVLSSSHRNSLSNITGDTLQTPLVKNPKYMCVCVCVCVCVMIVPKKKAEVELNI